MQTFFTYLTANGGFGVINSGDYKLTSQIEIQLGSKGFVVEGSGTEGTRFIASSLFSGSSQVFCIKGSGAQPGFYIGGFSVRHSESGSGTATIGFQVGDEAANAAVIAGFNTSTLKNIFIADFPTCFKVIHARLIRFEDCSAWNNNFVSSNTCLHITQNGQFTADLLFDRCQFVNSKSRGNYCVHIESNVGPYNIANGNGSVSGIKFRSCDFYAGDQAIKLYAGSSAWLTDIWFVDGCQIDQEVTHCVRAESNGASTLINNIHLDGMYANKATSSAFTFVSTGTGGNIKDVYINNCFITNAQTAAINFFGQAVASVHVQQQFNS